MRVSERAADWLLALPLAWALLLAPCAAARGGALPNILLVALDDFGYNDLALNNGSDSPTPNLDELARQGLRFTRHYAEGSCSPARAALLTGRYAARMGFHPTGSGLAPELETLPERLAAAGYASHLVGKWHLGGRFPLARPERHGFERWLGFIEQWYLAGPHADGGYAPRRPTYRDPWLEDERGGWRRYPGHLNDLLTERALRIVRDARRPWFLYLAYYAPHTPHQPAPRFARRYPDTPAGRYQALKAQLDSNLGRVFGALRAAGEWSDTLIVALSDNGGTASAWPSNAPFEGAKSVGYSEGGTRVPLLVSWPARWRPAVREDIAAIVDIYPSILASLGLDWPDGVDGAPVFDAPANRPGMLRWYSHHPTRGDWYSMLGGDGRWRWFNWEGLAERALRFDGAAPAAPRAGLPRPLAAGMRREMRRWRREATRVGGLGRERGGEWLLLRGDPFRRTPTEGAYTLGVTLPAAGRLAGAELALYEQPGYFRIAARGGRLLLEFDGHRAELAWPAGNACTSLALSAWMNKRGGLYHGVDEPSELALYLGGAPAGEERYRNFRISARSPSAPLKVRAWPGGGFGRVAISTRALGAREVAAELHPRLLAACP